jgi:hypothetical protein
MTNSDKQRGSKRGVLDTGRATKLDKAGDADDDDAATTTDSDESTEEG